MSSRSSVKKDQEPIDECLSTLDSFAPMRLTLLVKTINQRQERWGDENEDNLGNKHVAFRLLYPTLSICPGYPWQLFKFPIDWSQFDWFTTRQICAMPEGASEMPQESNSDWFRISTKVHLYEKCSSIRPSRQWDYKLTVTATEFDTFKPGVVNRALESLQTSKRFRFLQCTCECDDLWMKLWKWKVYLVVGAYQKLT